MVYSPYGGNPDGIPKNYMSFIDMINPFKKGGSPMGLISPLIWKNNVTGDGEGQCTGHISGPLIAIVWLFGQGFEDDVRYLF